MINDTGSHQSTPFLQQRVRKPRWYLPIAGAVDLYVIYYVVTVWCLWALIPVAALTAVAVVLYVKIDKGDKDDAERQSTDPMWFVLLSYSASIGWVCHAVVHFSYLIQC